MIYFNFRIHRKHGKCGGEPCRWVLRLPPPHSRGRGWLNGGRRAGNQRARLGGRISMEDGVFSPEGKASSAPSRSSSVPLLCGVTEEREGVRGRL